MKVNISNPQGLSLSEKQLYDLVRRALANGLTIGDNLDAAIVQLGETNRLVTSGTEFAFPKNMLPSRSVPLAFTPLFAKTAAGVDMQLFDHSPINITRTDGLYGVTVGFGSKSAGYIGEAVNSFVNRNNAVTYTVSGTIYNITSIPLGIGTWDVSAICLATGTPTGTAFVGAVSLTSAAMPADATLFGDAAFKLPLVPTAGSDVTGSIPSYRVTLTAAQSVYLTSYCVYTVAGGVKGYGRISASRATRYNPTGIVTGILWGG